MTDPYLSRFAQADTIVPGGVQGYDRYAYVNNNPIRYNDPSGHYEDEGCGSGNHCELPTKENPGSGGNNKDGSADGPSGGAACQGTNPSIVCLPTQAPQPTMLPNTPSGTPGFSLNPGPTPTPFPTSTTSTSPSPRIEWNFSWAGPENVDWIDAGIDGFGLLANGVALVASIIPGGQPVVVGAETTGGIVEGVGLVKSGYELFKGDPSSMLLQQTTSQAERVVVMIFRAERIAPGVGFIGNLVSLNINLKPQVSPEWVTP